MSTPGSRLACDCSTLLALYPHCHPALWQGVPGRRRYPPVAGKDKSQSDRRTLFNQPTYHWAGARWGSEETELGERHEHHEESRRGYCTHGFTLADWRSTSGSRVAAPPTQQDGLVNVAIGDVTVLQDVNIGVAAQVVANICGVQVKNVAVLALIVDRSGVTDTVCTTDQGDIDITQN